MKKSILRSKSIRNPVNHPATAFRKSHIIKVGSYENMPFFEDYFLWLKIISKGYLIQNTIEPLVLMHRLSLSERRRGFYYMKREFNFYMQCIKKNYLKKFTVLSFFLRFIYRLFPTILQNMYFLFPWRSRKDKIPKKYIKILYDSIQLLFNK